MLGVVPIQGSEMPAVMSLSIDLSSAGTGLSLGWCGTCSHMRPSVLIMRGRAAHLLPLMIAGSLPYLDTIRWITRARSLLSVISATATRMLTDDYQRLYDQRREPDRLPGCHKVDTRSLLRDTATQSQPCRALEGRKSTRALC
jgi:hypothetical protein